MLEPAFESQFHGQPEIIPTSHDGWHDGLGHPQIIPTSHDGWHDGWLSTGHAPLDGSGMSGSGHSGETHPSTGTSLASGQTLVGTPGGFQIDLLWDPSVANAPNGFTTGV